MQPKSTPLIHVDQVIYRAFDRMQGKKDTIAEFIDQSRVLVNVPCCGTCREVVDLGYMQTTWLLIRIPHMVGKAAPGNR